MVKDKESKMKETLKIMGLNGYVYGLSYLCMNAAITLLTCFVITVSICYMASDQISVFNGFLLFIATWLLSIGFLSLSIILQNFFQSSKLAPMAGPLILFLPTSIATFSVLDPVTGGKQNNWVQYLFMLPSFPYEVIVCELF